MKKSYVIVAVVCILLVLIVICVSARTKRSRKSDIAKSEQVIEPTTTPDVQEKNGDTPLFNSTVARSGWAELPATIESDNLIYGYHDKLPSDNTLRNYSFCFDKDKHCSIWVAYPLHSCYLGEVSRNDKWKFDPTFVDDGVEPNVKSAYKYDASGSSTHDRGHQLPAADRTRGGEDNMTTFYGTNVTPQLATLNRGRWKSLEDDVRDWICADTLYVVSGAHFDKGVKYDLIRDEGGKGKDCPIPTHYYKVLLRTKRGNTGKSVAKCTADELICIGFWIEHTAKPEREAVSVAEIERRTGQTFFPNVPNAPKGHFDITNWQ